jgi:hypothetical protein
MFTRTVTPDTKTGPDREQLAEEQFCPPHDFDATWALPSREDLTAETVRRGCAGACGRTELLVIDDAPTT